MPSLLDKWAQEDQDLKIMMEQTLSLSLEEAIEHALRFTDPDTGLLDLETYDIILSKLSEAEQETFTAALLSQGILVLPEGENVDEELGEALEDATLPPEVERKIDEIEELVDGGKVDVAQEIASSLSLQARRALGNRIAIGGEIKERLQLLAKTLDIMLKDYGTRLETRLARIPNPYEPGNAYVERKSAEQRARKALNTGQDFRRLQALQKNIDQVLKGYMKQDAFVTPAIRATLERLRRNGGADEHFVDWIDPVDTTITVDSDEEVESELEKDARYRHPEFVETIVINPDNAEHWRIADDILESETLNGAQVEKFSWDPLTGEFLFVYPGQHHSSLKTSKPFDDYVRGIVLPAQKTVAFRPFWPSWIQNDPGALRDPEIANFETSYDAQDAAQKALVGNGSSGWDFKFDMTNAGLTNMTGNPRW